ncbi:unnamed protein product [Linum trigynum]|uniref:Myb/SANT-like domain-containing protein n=1 Tax=Linum trigynum TaxID=586398 RepID=A0AAV2D808_9ROSI
MADVEMFEGSAVDKKAKEYNKWTEKEDEVFIESMLHLLETKEVECGNFKNGGLKKLEALILKKLPGLTENVKSRHRWFKGKYSAICDIKNGACSGFGWDAVKQTACGFVYQNDVLTGTLCCWFLYMINF